MEKSIDRRSFILGMTTAFAECVAAESKKAALTPPFYVKDYELIHNEIERIAREQGVEIWYEKNLDLPEKKRFCWFVIYKFPEILKEYIEIREKGFNPALNISKFYNFLGYGIAFGENIEKVLPRMREKRATIDSAAGVLFKPNEWPPIVE